jgi:hypothetical protein
MHNDRAALLRIGRFGQSKSRKSRPEAETVLFSADTIDKELVDTLCPMRHNFKRPWASLANAAAQ